jgi:hypothetical protein
MAANKLAGALPSKVTFPKFGEQLLTADHVKRYEHQLEQYGGLSASAPSPDSVFTDVTT